MCVRISRRTLYVPTTYASLLTKELDEFVVVYLDDVLVYSASLSDHPEHMRINLRRIRGARLVVKLSNVGWGRGVCSTSGA